MIYSRKCLQTLYLFLCLWHLQKIGKGFVFGCLLLVVLSFSSHSIAGKRDCDIADFSVLKAKVVGKADGDTIKVVLIDEALRQDPNCYHLQNSVRLLNIDTPETHYQAGGQEHSQGHWGEVAAKRMTELIPEGAEVELRFGGPAKDNYHRFLAEVVLGGVNLNEVMVKEGLAFPIFFAPQVEQAWKYVEGHLEAKIKQVGIFEDLEALIQTPREFRVSKTGKEEQMLIGNLWTGEIVEGSNYKSVPYYLRVFSKDREELKRTLKKSRGKASVKCADLLTRFN